MSLPGIEFWNSEKGEWQDSHSVLTWGECEWINNLTGKKVYRLKEELWSGELF